MGSCSVIDLCGETRKLASPARLFLGDGILACSFLCEVTQMSAGPVLIQRFIWAVCRCLLAKLMLVIGWMLM